MTQLNPYSDIPLIPPVPVGNGPFHMKGSAFRVTATHIDSYVKGGLAAVLARVTDEQLRQFWSRPFLAGEWYDVFGMVALVGHVARERGVPYFTAAADLSRMLALENVRGVYRALLFLTSPEFLAPRLSRIQSRYIDFGAVEVGVNRKGYCEATRRQHPAILVHWFFAIVSGFIPPLLEHAGAKDVRLRWGTPSPDAPLHGYETVRFRFELQWS